MMYGMPRSYSPASYDDNWCLKPPLLLWLAVIYLSRALTLPIAAAFCSLAGVSGDTVSLLRDLWSIDALLPSAIAAAVFYALCRRVPSASEAVRWIWRHGRILLAIAALLDVCLSLLAPIRQGGLNHQALLSMFGAGIDAYFLLYVLLARLARDTFAEFPTPLTATAK